MTDEEPEADPVKSPQPESHERVSRVADLDISDPATWPQFMTVDEVAHVIRLGKRATLGQIRIGEIQARKVGGTYRVSKDWLLKYLGYD